MVQTRPGPSNLQKPSQVNCLTILLQYFQALQANQGLVISIKEQLATATTTTALISVQLTINLNRPINVEVSGQTQEGL